MPFRRIRDFGDHSGEKTKHAGPLNKIKTAHRYDADRRSNQGWANKVFRTGRAYQKCNAKNSKRSLCKNAQREIDEDSSRRGRDRSSTNCSQTSANDITTNRGGRNKCRNRFANPTHPIKLRKRRTFSFWK